MSITLILTSAGMRMKNEILALLPKPAHQMKVAHIITAAKGEPDPSFAVRDVTFMRDLGFTVEDIDLEGKSIEELRPLFVDKDIVYVQGGNTFYLMKYICESGFDQLVQELIQQGKIYVGVSAGTIVAGTDIGTAEPADPNNVGLTDYTGMGLVDLVINPHHDRFGEEEAVQIYEHKTGKQVTRLTDNQMIVVVDGNIRIINHL
ncbi:TPA: hypothetical protein DD617_04630 [Candidatus Uhrbacteria bacterium]|nr:hypothetical protein [Candidatus Uhrbacteria bacterium]